MQTDGDRDRDQASAFLEQVRGGSNAGTRSIVLVVDDMPEMRKLVRTSIKRASPRVTVVEAGSGAEALAKLEEIREQAGRDPGLIVTDLEMPDMDGWKLIAALERDYRSRGLDHGIPLVVFTSTGGRKGTSLFGVSIHGRKCTYSPLVAVAKEACVRPWKFDGRGEKGILAWVEHFLRGPVTF